ncbi:MAG: ABC transporter substrate-binding protein [Betaproteobacteria bacterium]|nr:ABC transporter substrate-binding protein [Betaproteobacteria bacterium]
MKPALVIPVLAFIGLAFGCAELQAQEARSKNTSAQTASALPTREVVDMAGRTVKLRQEIKRIGTLGSVPMMNTFVESLGAGKLIYNQPTKFHDIYGRWKMHLEFAPQIARGPHFQSPNHELLIENILEADPDVCITNSRTILETLDRVGIPTVFVDWSTVERMMDSVTMMGEVLHQQERAATYIRYFTETKERLTALGKSIPPSKRRTVLFGTQMQLQFRVPGNLTEAWLEAIAADSVTRDIHSEGRREYDIEELLKWDPEVIFLTNRKTAEELKKNPLFKNVRAVKNNAIVIAPVVGHMWSGVNVEAPIAACWMMHKLYPELMPKEQLVKEIKYFYKTFFAYDMSDQKIDEIIAGGGNG